MRIYVSHSASVATAGKSNRDEAMAAAMRAGSGGRPWFVVEPIDDPEQLQKQVRSLVQSGRTVVELDVGPNLGLVSSTPLPEE